MSEMLIKRYEYSTLWHVEVDPAEDAEELLGEFSVEEEDPEEKLKEEVEDEEQDSLNNGVKFQLPLVAWHFSNN